MSIYQSINAFCFMFPVGCSVAGSTRIGNFLGAGDANGAALAARVSVGSAFLVSAIMGTLLVATPHSFFPSLFTPDAQVVAQARTLLPLLAIYVVGDGIQSALNGIIKGCGRQCVIMPIVVFAYWVVGLPLGYYLAFVQNDGVMCEDSFFCGVRGLVMGLTVGTFVHMFLLALIVVCTTNWSREAELAKERMALDVNHGGGQQVSSWTKDGELNSVGIMSL
jgi:MATE family multidrug resistance protein